MAAGPWHHHRNTKILKVLSVDVEAGHLVRLIYSVNASSIRLRRPPSGSLA